jgi:inward rectifier potassium channel
MFRSPSKRTPAEIAVVGAPRTPWTDLYHELLRAPWWLDILALAALFLLINLAFAFGYRAVGGVGGARPDSLADHFFFSVQTMGTIGYGVLYPQSEAAQALVTTEVIVGVSLVALTTGMLFAKFSVPRARMQFAEFATVSPMNGIPTLMFRLGNERASSIIEATVRVVMVYTERTAEGVTYYRMRDLALLRERSPALARSWNVMHRIDESSLLHGATPESLERDEVEFILTVVGIDEASAQNVSARHTYDHSQVVWGARHADMLSEREDGGLTLDMREFHGVVATKRTDGFPYPK